MLAAVSTALLAAVFSPTADAAGFYFTDSGTRAMSRAGAFVAGADDLSAQYYNPAALINLDRGQAYVNFSAFKQNVSFVRKDYDETGALTETWPEITQQAPPMYIPALGFGHHFGLPNTYFAVGMWTPVAPTNEFDPNGSTQYTLTDSLTWQIWGGPSVAHRFFGWLTVGGGVHWTLVRAEKSLSMMVCQDEEPFDGEIQGCPADTDPATNNLDAQVSVWDKARVHGNFGIHARPVEWLSIGASAVPPINVHAKGSIAVDLKEDHWLLEGDGDGNLNVLGSGHAQDDDVTVLLTMPWIIRMGVAVRPVPELEIEATAVHQRWSATKELRVTDINLVLQDNPDNPLLSEDQAITDDVVLPAGYQDAWSLRLGGDYDIAEVAAARAGVFYETSGVPEGTVNVSLVDAPKFGYALGGGGRIADRVEIDAGFIHSFLKTRELTNSSVRRVEVPVDFGSVLAGEPLAVQDGQVVGNGTMKSSYWMASLGVSVLFGQKQSEM
ncbi:MAG: outer membrane protein transport protein [Alphaproteobacteria bacterium]|nr:outer membrane protein transport protein [Alphaproteobacteria bacterium]